MPQSLRQLRGPGLSLMAGRCGPGAGGEAVDPGGNGPDGQLVMMDTQMSSKSFQKDLDTQQGGWGPGEAKGIYYSRTRGMPHLT